MAKGDIAQFPRGLGKLDKSTIGRAVKEQFGILCQVTYRRGPSARRENGKRLPAIYQSGERCENRSESFWVLLNEAVIDENWWRTQRCRS